MRLLGERQVIVDCDVLQADGGTRTASICGGYLALHDALSRLVQAGKIAEHPLTAACAAISVGIVDGHAGARPALRRGLAGRGRHERGDDRRRAASSRCRAPPRAAAFTRAELDALLALAESGIAEIIGLQQEMAPRRRPPPAMSTR